MKKGDNDEWEMGYLVMGQGRGYSFVADGISEVGLSDDALAEYRLSKW